ncbi:MAG: alpha/beta fold hydrolase [Alphaproteobacteria bacterium]|nr:alpha/beta fold hydrolase [Alphaproteobacteria bacterium]MCW5742761.1 alpha/beta fold hydrolase [Alphaproteobacteria bacterium]
MPTAKANGLTIAYETSGDPRDPTILLVMGLGAQLTLWPDAFVEALAANGLHVVRYDNRDVGLSSDFDSSGVVDMNEVMMRAIAGKPLSPPYTVADMAADGIGLLDALGIRAAHVAGLSMGGMIVPHMAARHADRVRSMTVIMSSSGRRGLPPGKPEAMKMLMTRPMSDDRAEVLRHSMALRRAIGGPAYPENEEVLRATVERQVDRRYYPQGVGRQYYAVIADGDRTALLKSLKLPTLVIHGSDDPLLPVECGRDVAASVPGAAMHEEPGMGHEIPGPLCQSLAAKIAAHCKAAAEVRSVAAE